MTSVPPGWHDDGSGSMRWWNGSAWTEHVLPSPAAESPPPAPRKAGSRWPWVLGIAGGALLVAGIVAAVVVPLALSRATHPATVVMEFDRVWKGLDCPGVERVTTPAYREDWYESCDSWLEAMDELAYVEYTTVVTGSSVEGPTAQVATSESWVSRDGPGSAEFVYTLVFADGRWRINAVSEGAL